MNAMILYDVTEFIRNRTSFDIFGIESVHEPLAVVAAVVVELAIKFVHGG